MMKIERCCRTCVYWDKPPGKKALADRHYPCKAPIPSFGGLPWPHSVAIDLKTKPMERDEGVNCRAWMPRLHARTG